MQKNYTEDPVLHYTYKEGKLGRANWRIKVANTEDNGMDPPVSQPDKGGAEGGPPGVSRGRPNLDWFLSPSDLPRRYSAPSYVSFQMFPYLPPPETALGNHTWSLSPSL
jgi:hypothetical protein